MWMRGAHWCGPAGIGKEESLEVETHCDFGENVGFKVVLMDS